MTRDQRIDAAANVIFDRRDRDGCRDIAAIALEAALADVGGLDGLALDADDDAWQARLLAERDALCADRDRLREALRVITTQAMPGSLNERTAQDALRESEAGT